MSQIVRNRKRRSPKPTSKTTKPVEKFTQLPMLRTSERGTFKRCRYKWWLEFHQTIKPKTDIPPLRFGTYIHRALAVYYKPGIKRGPHPRPVFEEIFEADIVEQAKLAKMNPRELEENDRWMEHRELGIDMLDRYVETYGKDDEWKVLVTEFPFQIAVQDRHTPLFWYVGTVDGVWQSRRNKRIVIPDHKTTAAINTGYLSMDPQATAYWTFGWDAILNGKLVDPGTRLDGILFNFLRKAKSDPRPYIVEDGRTYYLNKPTVAEKKEHGDNYPGSISKSQPPPYFARVPIYRDAKERERVRQTVIDEFREIEQVHNGTLQPYKNPGQFTCPGCWALDICELHEIGSDHEEMTRQTTKSWNPYDAHEVKDAR